MAINNNFESNSSVEQQLKNFVESKRPKDEEMRKKIDLGYSWDGQNAFLFSIRPQWDNPTNIMEFPYAKLRYVKASKEWKLYWLRGNGKWEIYEPSIQCKDLKGLLEEVKMDRYGCFFG